MVLDNRERSRLAAMFVAKAHRGKLGTRFNPHHDKAGKFGSGHGGGTALKSHVELSETAAVDLAARTKQPSGGFTVDPSSGTDVSSGFAVAIYPELSRTVPASALVKQSLKDYVHDNPDAFSNPENKFGAWHDPESGEVWLDVSRVVQDRNTAVELGKKHNQIAIWDIGAGEEVSTGGTGR